MSSNTRELDGKQRKMRSQEFLKVQLRTLIDLANKAELYDAADWIHERAFSENKINPRLWRVTVKTRAGSKRGEFLVPSEKLQSTVEGISTEHFIYDCQPERN